MKPEVLRAVAHAVSQERSLEIVLKRIVEGLAGSGGIALARVWLRRNPAEFCERCRARAELARKVPRLHLIASAGRPISAAYRHEDWSRLDGEFHWGGAKVADIESHPRPILVKSVKADHKWIEKPDWARHERIQSFAGYPLIESELFGHVKGAFSGAVAGRVGRFQTADRGTLYLDEIGELPRDLQPKLLRVLQEGEFEQVGDNVTRRVNVRIIAATNRDLHSLVRARRFREDLYYRLSVFPIEVPPLRERKEDIPLLARHFLEVACKRFNRAGLKLEPNQLKQLQNYNWPGNVRELQNVIERAVITSRLGTLKLDIPGSAESGSSASGEESGVVSEKEMNRRMRDNLVAALKRSGGRIYGSGGAAELLGIKPSTLTTRIKKLGLK